MNNFGIKTKILVGNSALGEVLAKSRKIFIVTDSFMLTKIDYITNQINGQEFEIFSEIMPDPDIEVISKGVEVISKFQPDVVVAYGGGSPIDAAKALIYFAKRTGSITNCELVAIPTTSGTGSEVTRFSVVSDKAKQIKYPLVDESLLPDIAILDAELIKSVPPQITADTGVDVITHALEAFVSTNANDFTDALAEKAFKLAYKNLFVAYKEPNNTKARESMHNASCLAGMAFDNASLGINHGMAHIIGARFKLPHGRANAIILPYVVEFNAGITKDRMSPVTDAGHKYAELAKSVGISGSSSRQLVLNFSKALKKMSADMGIPTSLSAAGVDINAFKENLNELVSIAIDDKCSTTNPVTCTNKNIEELFLTVFNGK